MKKASVFYMIIIIFTLVGCDSTLIKNDENSIVYNEEVSSTYKDKQSQISSIEYVEGLYTGENNIFYIVEENETIISSEIEIEDSVFKGELIVMTPVEEERFISLYINNKQVQFNIEGSTDLVHKIKLLKGKNKFKIEIKEELKDGINECMLLNSGVNQLDNKFTTLIDIRFKLKNNNDIEVSSHKPNIIYPYEVIGENSEKSSYFNLRKDDYLNKNFNNKNNNIKAKSGEKIIIPTIITSNAIEKNSVAKIIIDGVQVSEGIISINEENKEVFIPFELVAPNEEGKHIVNIVILNQYDYGIIINASQEIEIEVIN